MAHPGTITSLRYLKANRLDPIVQIQRDYYRNLIYSYGTDVTYFRHDANPYESPSGINNYDYIYGEDSTKTYFLSAPMVIFMDMQGDAAILNKFGIETDGDADCFILIDDFTEEFRDKIGTPDTSILSTYINTSIENSSAIISGVISNNELNGYTSAYTLFGTSGNITYSYNGGYIRTPILYNNYTYKSEGYTDRVVNGALTGELSGYIDENGNGNISGIIQGSLQYYTANAGKYGGKSGDITPQIGDFFRLEFENEEYEITRILDRNLQADGLNLHLNKYIWQLSVVRRDPSNEPVLGDLVGAMNEEPNTTSKEEFNEWSNTSSNKIFDYDTEEVDENDLINSDDIYGGYGYND